MNVTLFTQNKCYLYGLVSNLNWMLCYKHVLVIDREYCDMLFKVHHKRNQNLEDSHTFEANQTGCRGPVHVTFGIEYKHMS